MTVSCLSLQPSISTERKKQIKVLLTFQLSKHPLSFNKFSPVYLLHMLFFYEDNFE